MLETDFDRFMHFVNKAKLDVYVGNYPKSDDETCTYRMVSVLCTKSFRSSIWHFNSKGKLIESAVGEMSQNENAQPGTAK